MVADISRQPNVEMVAWLLMVTIVQIYSEKEQMGQKFRMYSLDLKSELGRLKVGPRHVKERIPLIRRLK